MLFIQVPIINCTDIGIWKRCAQHSKELGDVNIISSIKEGGSVDLNNVNGNINYYFDDSLPLNGPTDKKYGMFIQRQKGRLRSQVWYDWGSDKIEVYSRYYWNDSGTWTTSPWMRIDNFGCNTLAELKAALANV